MYLLSTVKIAITINLLGLHLSDCIHRGWLDYKIGKAIYFKYSSLIYDECVSLCVVALLNKF